MDAKSEELHQKDGRMVVKVAKAMYGLIQLALLWYKELTGFLEEESFKRVKADGCILHKKTEDGIHILLIMYVDDILILSEEGDLCKEVRLLIERKYQKVTCEMGDKINYLGMILERVTDGFTISMKAYVMDILKEYGKDVKKCISLAKANLFEAEENDEVIKDRAKFHMMVAKLLYLGKRGRADILLPVQYLCMRVKHPTKGDIM
jgi:hypothetical protein